MIWESKYWKDDLINYSNKLEKRINQKKWFDSSYANAEKEIMISAFMIRKLDESNKLSDELMNQQLKIIEFENNGKKIDITKRLVPERYFEIDKPNKGIVAITDLCNSIIHSYIFSLIFIENTFKYFWVASDYNKFNKMFQIEIVQFIRIMKEIGYYWPNKGFLEYDKKRKDYRFKWS
jgi:hypothetical protein